MQVPNGGKHAPKHARVADMAQLKSTSHNSHSCGDKGASALQVLRQRTATASAHEDTAVEQQLASPMRSQSSARSGKMQLNRGEAGASLIRNDTFF